MSVPGHVLDLLYQSWPVAPYVRADLHQWADPGAMAESALAGWDFGREPWLRSDLRSFFC
jgi:hypothetical protein